ncbi:unnamed protein product [Rotaria sp. Silwood2]|nr:unnamed protein product [Rotaria sp. Silwood2]CAF2689005.1 unnamed protein product [Rotaria sp. Silwood2]CAF3098742.1 unnamed protein product [Rotaria sp. Silwood2]CAF3395215.1 unnamed protein product [Rotaria sp. Silwood2]CAF3863893.1 unnamed protein product [Rotaria sp. Silwood2]
MYPTRNPFWNDILAGFESEITTVTASHPIETILIQRNINSPEVHRNAFHSLQLIYQRQGIINGFYRGNIKDLIKNHKIFPTLEML